jgi:hypothetical protein
MQLLKNFPAFTQQLVALRWYKKNPKSGSQHFMEAKGSLPFSHEPSTGPILSYIDPVHNTPFYLSKVYFNIVYSLTCWSSP